MEYKEVQEALLDKNARRAANAVEQFTVQHIIDYIEAHCVTDNDKTLVQQLTNAFNDMVRPKGQTLLNWLQSFSPLMTRYRRAFGLNNAISDDVLKRLWKLHFAKQVNTSEHQVMLNFRKDHLTTNEVGKINTLSEGIFDIAVMKKLLTKLGTSLVYYEPDAMVKSYLYQHAYSLGWAKDKLNFSNPKDKGSHNRREPGDSKRKRPTTRGEVAKNAKSERPKPNTSKVSTRDQCRRKACRDKGNHINHTHQDCRFKTNDQPPPTNNGRRDGTRHPNLGLAPPKKVKFSKLATPAVGSANKQETRTCYICNKPGHIAPNCPDKEANKQNAKSKLFKNKNFMVLWQET
jgi:hypothetical protein